MRTDTRTLEEEIADRNTKLDALHDKLTTAVEQLITGDDWRRALTFAARFRSRSTGGVGVFEVRECVVDTVACLYASSTTSQIGPSDEHESGTCTSGMPDRSS